MGLHRSTIPPAPPSHLLSVSLTLPRAAMQPVSPIAFTMGNAQRIRLTRVDHPRIMRFSKVGDGASRRLCPSIFTPFPSSPLLCAPRSCYPAAPPFHYVPSLASMPISSIPVPASPSGVSTPMIQPGPVTRSPRPRLKSRQPVHFHSDYLFFLPPQLLVAFLLPRDPRISWYTSASPESPQDARSTHPNVC